MCNWITLLCTWNIVSQLCLNKIYMWRENKEKQILKEINPEYSLEGLMLKRHLWLSDAKNWLIRKDPDAGKDRRQEKGMTEDEMVGWHHWLNGHEFGQTPGDSGGQWSLVCCSPQGRKESDTTERLNWAELRLCQSRQSESLTDSWSWGFKVWGWVGGSDHHLLFLWGTGSWDTYLGPQLSCLGHGKLRTQQLTEKKHHFWDWEVRVYLTLNVSKHSPRSTGWDLV